MPAYTLRVRLTDDEHGRRVKHEVESGLKRGEIWLSLEGGAGFPRGQGH